VDALQSDVAAIVGRRLTSDRREAFDAISTLAHERAGTRARCRWRSARRDPAF
jgi:hypothetical protein